MFKNSSYLPQLLEVWKNLSLYYGKFMSHSVPIQKI